MSTVRSAPFGLFFRSSPFRTPDLRICTGAYTNGVLQYAHKHANEIESDMNAFSTLHKSKLREKRRNGIKHKRVALTHPSITKCQVYCNVSNVKFTNA